MSIAPKLSYRHSIFPIGFKIPLIIELKYIYKKYFFTRHYFWCIEPILHGIHSSDFERSILPLIHFKDNEFKTWVLYFKEYYNLTNLMQCRICCDFSNLYGFKYLISLLPNSEKSTIMKRCFITAARNGSLNIVKYLISLDINLIVHKNIAVLEASHGGNLDIVIYLMSLGADINLNDKSNVSLRWVAGNNHLGTVRYLVSLGVDITNGDNAAVREAAYNGYLETVRYLVSLGADITALENYAVRWASKNGHLETVRYLVSQGADVTANNNESVRVAFYCGHHDTVRYLVSLGEDILTIYNEIVRSYYNSNSI